MCRRADRIIWIDKPAYTSRIYYIVWINTALEYISIDLKTNLKLDIVLYDIIVKI